MRRTLAALFALLFCLAPAVAQQIYGSPWTYGSNGLLYYAPAPAAVGTSAPGTGNIFEVDTPTSLVGPGTASVTASGTTVTGVSTAFLTSFAIGQSITLTTSSGSETKTISAIASDTSMTTAAWTGNASAVAYTLAGGSGICITQSGELNLTCTAPVNGAIQLLRINKAFGEYTLATGIVGISVQPTVANTTAAMTVALVGLQISPSVGTTNTQNWTNTTPIVAVRAQPSVGNPASGTIAKQNAFYATLNNGSTGGAILTTAVGFEMATLTATGTVTNFIGLNIGSITQATNNTDILIGTATPVVGNFGIYQSTTKDNLFSGHIRTGSAPPSSGTPTSCGTGSPTVIGSDTDGLITTGTAATACTITFTVAYTSAPFCVVASQTQLAAFTYTITNSTIVLSLTATTGDKVNYHCVAQSGG